MIVFVIVFSLFFYYKSSGLFFLMLAATSFADWLISKRITRTEKKRVKKIWVFLSLCLSLGILGYFKYANFFLINWNAIVQQNFQPLDIVLPVGISFYTFQSVSYIIDVYKGRVAPTRTWLEYLFYLSFFPQLVAGPIVRADYFLPQIGREHRVSSSAIYTGLWLVLLGIIKKAVVADYIAQYNDLIFNSPTAYSGFENLMGIWGYTMQIYCDFSGYSDMAIGITIMMGFDLGKNFNYPYQSRNLTEFWRRWHISLGSWFRDYIYIPLGGNRVSTLKHIRNILVVWALTGLWHGASWNFVLWGVYYGLFLLLEKFVLQKYLKKIPSWLCTVYTMLVVMIGWVFFSQTDFGALGHYLGTMFGIGASGFIDKTALYYLKTGFILLLISILMCRPAPYQYFKRLVRRRPVAAVIINLILFALSIAYMVYNSYTPFLYAKF